MTEQQHAFDIDLTREEARRQAEVVAALGDAWDPAAVLDGEREAYRMLYSSLDEEQLAVYRRLEAAGVLPPLEGYGHAAD
ncbi:DUF6400 family protein [Streptomyces sp. ICBB 8177]|uniref:DUF6400 family protein n=1 Tax=Streptomyces sp. ICBB 8177 TaxID=563922 RepID=UPI000D67BA10|nr:DUF6400 family protein [Streptomyces sp. ICBB 8177]PWI41479.1 hypothetical protein CK485_21580 [Streptomyces sp. ICBB 8177]